MTELAIGKSKIVPRAVPLPPTRIAAIGDWLRTHQVFVRRLQWAVIAIYTVLIIVPTLLPLPDNTAHMWNNVTRFAQFLFWGVWWPGVLISMLVFGRLWCGIMCPEGALSEMASSKGLGRAVPKWIRWRGWPFTAFVMTTVYGQMISVYQYPRAVLLILGGSTVAAIIVGYVYGRNHRVWCRYLCPVNGVFGLLSKLAPLHYKVNTSVWGNCPPKLGRTTKVSCAPLVPLGTMQSASPCHMCGRCSGFRNAIELSPRIPGNEIETASVNEANMWDSLLIIVGILGVATGAFHWSSSPWYIQMKQWAAHQLILAKQFWALEADAPWWLLTNYPAQNDVLTLLDGVTLLAYLTLTTLIVSSLVAAPIALVALLSGTKGATQRFHHLVHGLIPIAAFGLILGLSALTFSLLRADGIYIGWTDEFRAALLTISFLWSGYLMYKVLGTYVKGITHFALMLPLMAAMGVPIFTWVLMFWVW
jgi:polyferredoxin